MKSHSWIVYRVSLKIPNIFLFLNLLGSCSDNRTTLLYFHILRWASLNFSSAFLSSILIFPPRSIFHLWNDQVECNNTNGSQRHRDWTQHLKHWNREGCSLITSMFQIKKTKTVPTNQNPAKTPLQLIEKEVSEIICQTGFFEV